MENTYSFVIAPSFVSAADCAEFLIKKHAAIDVVVTLKKDGSINFRRRNACFVNCRTLARLFNGGGQTFAATGYLNQNVNSKNFIDILFLVDQKLKEHFITV